MEPRPRNSEKSEAVPPIQTRKTRLEGLVRKVGANLPALSGPTRGRAAVRGDREETAAGSHRTGHRARAAQHRAAQGDGRREAPGLAAQKREDTQAREAELLTLQMSSLPLAGPLPRSPRRLASLANRQETPAVRGLKLPLESVGLYLPRHPTLPPSVSLAACPWVAGLEGRQAPSHGLRPTGWLCRVGDYKTKTVAQALNCNRAIYSCGDSSLREKKMSLRLLDEICTSLLKQCN